MIGIVERIASLLGVGRSGGEGGRRKKREVIVRRKKDTVTISDEARRLSVDGTDGADDRPPGGGGEGHGQGTGQLK
jgi:hypothetical protein